MRKFERIENFFSIEKCSETAFFQLHRKTDIFLRETALICQEILNFLRKALFFGIKIMADSEIRTRNLWLTNCGDILHKCNIYDTNASAATKSARHGQNQDKEQKLRLLIPTFSSRNIFPTENNYLVYEISPSNWKFVFFGILIVGFSMARSSKSTLQHHLESWSLISISSLFQFYASTIFQSQCYNCSVEELNFWYRTLEVLMPIIVFLLIVCTITSLAFVASQIG